jgi:hypothetical protein
MDQVDVTEQWQNAPGSPLLQRVALISAQLLAKHRGGAAAAGCTFQIPTD